MVVETRIDLNVKLEIIKKRLKIDRHFGSRSADVPVKFPSDMTI